MKKLILLTLSFVLVLSLFACAQAQTPATTGETKPQTQTTAAPGETTEAVPETTAATVVTTAPQDPKELAQSFENKPLSELIAVIGEPQSAEYAPSCLHPGVGEDGMLYYDGFVVYTYKEGDTETVQYAE